MAICSLFYGSVIAVKTLMGKSCNPLVATVLLYCPKVFNPPDEQKEKVELSRTPSKKREKTTL